MYCSKCGTPIMEGASFCKQCGAPAQKHLSAQEKSGAETEKNMSQDHFVDPQQAVETNQNINTDFYEAENVQNTWQEPVQYGQYQPQMPPYYNNYNIPIKNYDPSKDYTPISMWGYFGYQILFAIPLIGFILILIFSFGGTRNINLRNYARSTFCFFIIVAIVALLIALIAVSASI